MTEGKSALLINYHVMGTTYQITVVVISSYH